jgi:hypothetical protein
MLSKLDGQLLEG